MVRVAILLLALVVAVPSVAWGGVFDDAPEDRVTVVRRAPTEVVYGVGEAEVRLSKAPGPDEPDTAPRCRGSGVDLHVRGELAEADASLVARACERLAFDAPQLASPRPHVAVVHPDRTTFGALRLLTWLWVLAVLAIGLDWRDRALVPILMGAAAVRWVLGGPRIFMGVAYPYDRLLTFAGLREPNLRYGQEAAAFADAVRPLVGNDPQTLHLVHLVVSVAAVGLAHRVAGILADDQDAARVSGCVLAGLPLAVALGMTETTFVLAATLLLGGVAGIVRGGRAGDALAVLSLVLLAHTRPLQLVAVLAGGVALAGRRRWTASVLVLGGVVWRVQELMQVPLEAPMPGRSAWGLLLARPIGAGSHAVVTDPFVDPAWLLPAAILGLVVTWRRRPEAHGALRAVVVVLIAASLPYLPFPRPTDLWRFHLPAAGLWAVLAGLSWPWWQDRPRWAQAAAIAFVGFGLALAARPLGGPMVHAVEHAWVRDVVCPAHRGETIHHLPARDPQGAWARWVQVSCDITWRRLGDAEPPPGSLRWVGRADRLAGRTPCDGEVLVETTTPPYNAGLVDLGLDPVRLALVRCAP